MKILMVAYGSRGDVQPSLALALGLTQAGHAVTLMAGENFETWVTSYGFGFIPAPDTEQIMASEMGKTWTSARPNSPQELQAMGRVFDRYGLHMFGLIGDSIGQFDLVLSGFASLAFVQTAAERYGVPQINIQLQPYRPTALGATSLVRVTEGTLFANRWMGYLAQRLIWGLQAKPINQIRAQLGLKAHTAGSYLRAVNAIPTVNGFSAHVAPRPDDWPDYVHTVGYWFQDESAGWMPPVHLVEFLELGAPPVYVGFGSMTSRDPQGMFRMVSEAVAEAGQRAVVMTGWSGLNVEDVPPHLCLIDNAPHDWLFQRVGAVVHHGGAGTTAAGLRWGKPTFIIPHLGDQVYWGRRVRDLGVGPKAVNRIDLKQTDLTQAVRRLTSDLEMAQRAAVLGEAIRSEDGVSTGVAAIEREARRLGVG
ncbi:MAG: glycosyltransferase [Anaerolineae bacterium]|jgi:UDP:flavonoid glycosyltransferase YjiC (YdhE family)|nr:glycosyltransferase [Anaerolineae bacterium]